MTRILTLLLPCKLDQYQEQSHLLDPYLESMVTPCMQRLRDLVQQRPIVPEQAQVLFRFLYLLTKTRGYKTIGKCRMATKDCTTHFYNWYSEVHVSWSDWSGIRVWIPLCYERYRPSILGNKIYFLYLALFDMHDTVWFEASGQWIWGK